MLKVDLCWDENGRGVVVAHGDRRVSRTWPFRLYALGTGCVEKRALSDELVDQLDQFGSAPLRAIDEPVIVSRISAV